MRLAFRPLAPLLALLLAVPLAGPALAAETAEAVLNDLAAHGYTTPPAALQRLRAAQAPGPAAPLEARWRYETSLAGVALEAGEDALARAALSRLQAMADREACAPCRHSQLLVALRLENPREPGPIRQGLARMTALPEPADPFLLIDWLLARASAQFNLGEAEPAITDALRAAELAAAKQQPANQVVALELLGRINATRRDFQRADEYARRAIALARSIGFKYKLASLLFNHSYTLAQQKETRERKAVLQELLQLAEELRIDAGLMQNTLINLAALSNDLGEYRQAVDYAQRAEALSDLKADPNGYAFSLVNRGVAWVHLGRADEGLALVQQAVTIGEQSVAAGGDKRELADLMEQQVNALEAAGRWQPALQTLRRWVTLDAELTRSQREQAIAQLQESVAAQQRLREIERLRLEQARGEAELQLRRWRERAWAGAALIVALLAFITWQRLSRSRRINRRLRKDMARLSDESNHDALTGAHNRRFGEALLQRLATDNAARPEGQRHKVALLLLDADHFKRVNDGHGHAAGDAVLIELTRRLQAMLRDGDAVVRWGGEEFLLILPRADEAGLRALAPRVLAAIGSAPIAIGEGKSLEVRVSAGGVIWEADGASDWPLLLALADAALYRAKAEGRNRVVCAWAGAGLAAADAEQLEAAVQQGRLRLETVAGVPMPG
ncbi:diguanylate cyclase domain-containing protein [Inhella sp.]|uniref:GGDEF domain-containing protein n=1 Tax=Inhella sp. TaxID=1921806 RepID=UPI0035AFD7D0